jgi:vWA domain found in the FtsH ternary systems/N-terminal helical region fused to the FtsH ternary system vWA domain
VAHDLTREELSRALPAWCCLTGFGEALSESLPASLSWLRARWDAGDDHLPLPLVHDLGHLLLRGRDFRFASSRDLEHWPESERAQRLAYEDRVLGRWALDPTVVDAHVVIAGMDPTHREAAVAHAVGLALARPLRDAEAVVRGNSAHLRALTESLLAALPQSFEGWSETLDPSWRAWALEQSRELSPLLPSGRLFAAEDLWEIAHLPQLPNESARLALREINGLAGRIGSVPASVALSVRQTAREVPVEAEDADHYPAGGFDAISTRGAFENLVRSEVAYVGEGAAETGGVDLFDVRFAESELLYYTRDESPLLDARRDLTVVLDHPAEQRYKQPALEAQTLVLAEALALALQSDLLRVFGPAGSRVRIVWRCETAEDRTVADEERDLLSLPLGAELAHRRVELSRVDLWSEVPDAGRVVFSPRAPAADLFHVAWVRVGEAAWQALDGTWELREGPTVMRALADALLVAVARRRVRRTRGNKGSARK